MNADEMTEREEVGQLWEENTRWFEKHSAAVDILTSSEQGMMIVLREYPSEHDAERVLQASRAIPRDAPYRRSVAWRVARAVRDLQQTIDAERPKAE